MERKNLAEKPEWQEKRQRLWKLLLDHTGKTRPQVLEPVDREEPDCPEAKFRFKTIPAPRFPGDMPGRWFGFHCKDYSVDTFH